MARGGGEGHETHVEFLKNGEEGLIVTVHHGVAVLNGRDRADGMGAAQIVLTDLGNAVMEDLAFFNDIKPEVPTLFRVGMNGPLTCCVFLLFSVQYLI